MIVLDPDLQALVDNQTLRHVSSDGGMHEYVIDAFRHRQMTGMGWQVFIYRLSIDEEVEEGSGGEGGRRKVEGGMGAGRGEGGIQYEISEESEYQGGDVLLSTDSADEVVCWIEERSLE